MAVAGTAMLFFSSGVWASGSHHSSTPQPTGSASRCDVPGKACDPSKTDHDNGVGNNCDPGYGQGNQAKYPPDESTTSCRSKTSTEKASPATEKKSSGTEENSETAKTSGSVGACDEDETSDEDHESSAGANHESMTAEDRDTENGQETASDTCGASGGVEGQSGGNTTGSAGGSGTETGGSGTETMGGGSAPSTVLGSAGGVGSGSVSAGVGIARPNAVAGAAAPNGGAAASGSVLGAAASAMTGAGAAAANAVQGMPLAATGLPIIGGIVGFLLVAFGLVAARRS